MNHNIRCRSKCINTFPYYNSSVLTRLWLRKNLTLCQHSYQVSTETVALPPACPCPPLSTLVAGKRRKRRSRRKIRRLIMDLLRNRLRGVVVDVPYVIRYMLWTPQYDTSLRSMLCGSVSCVNDNNGRLSYKGYIAMTISPLLPFFFWIEFTFFFLLLWTLWP